MIDYLPIATTVFSLFFAIEIFRHYRGRRTLYLLWWTIGVITFGLGTLTESIDALLGWQPWNFKAWYIMGALLGGFPLAQGSVYLLLPRKFGHMTTVIFLAIIGIAVGLVLASPVNPPDDGRLSGKSLGFQQIRWITPAINIYALIFLVGGAFYSAYRYYRMGDRRARFKGNILIAVGALLPGIGGTCARFGYVEVLFLTELIGLLLIYVGYRMIKSEKHKLFKKSIE